MKLKIVIKVPMYGEKGKSKALQIAAGEEGVSSVSIGKENDEVEVIGEGVDSVCLAKSLRKKFCFADIVSVEEVKPPENPTPPPPPPPPPCPTKPEHCCHPPPFQLQTPFYVPQYYYETEPPNCSLM